MPRLLDLEPQLRRHVPNGLGKTDSLELAQGLTFLCPKCFVRKGGVVGVHSVLVWFAGRCVPPNALPAPRWNVRGTSLGDLSLTPSIDLTCKPRCIESPCRCCHWHGYVTSGIAT